MNQVENKGYTIERSFFALGTINTIKIYEPLKEGIIERVVARVMEIEDHMSAFKPESDLMQLNKYAGIKPIKMHEDTMTVLLCARKYAQLSEGAFDYTIRPITELWGIGKKQNEIPEEAEIQERLQYVNYKDVEINEKKQEAFLRRKGMALDLGGIAKGFAADEVKRILKEEGVQHALINLGGNVVTMSKSESNLPYKIGVQNPTAPTGQYVGILSVKEKTIVTSGVNERFFVKDQIRYHHLLDPRTGWPVRSNLLSVTVVADSSMEADAISTCIFVKGIEAGSKLLKMAGMDAIFLTETGEIYATAGLQKDFMIHNQQVMQNS